MPICAGYVIFYPLNVLRLFTMHAGAKPGGEGHGARQGHPRAGVNKPCSIASNYGSYMLLCNFAAVFWTPEL